MSKTRRILKVLAGLIQIFAALLVLLFTEKGLVLLLYIISAALAFSGIKDIVRYFTMARFMVGGRQILYRGCIMLNFGVFSYSLSSASRIYVALYLIGIYAFDGVVDLLRAREAKALKSGHWRLRMTGGAVKILLAVICAINIGSADTLFLLLSTAMIYSALARIASAFRRTAVVYVQRQ